MNRSQHKEQKGINRRELTDLKQENKHLKRRVSRLQKLIEKGEFSSTEGPPEEEDVPEEDIENESNEPSGPIRCKICGPSGKVGSYKTITGKVIYGCKTCKKWKYSEPVEGY